MVGLLRKLAPRGVLLTALLLLFAQQGAQWHAYAHGDQRPAESARQPAALVSHGACSDCLGFAPLLATGGAPAWLPALGAAPQRSILQTRIVAPPDRGLILAFRSRAPPR